MKRFNQLEYLTDCTNLDKNISNERNTERGFMSFLSDALSIIDTNTQDREKGLSVVELGIGGGGSHENWSNHLSNDCTVYGVDLFSKDHYLNYKNEIPFAQFYYLHNFDHLCKSQDDSTRMLTDDRGTDVAPCKIWHGVDAYSHQAVDLVVSHNKSLVDFVVDDGDVTSLTADSLDCWKNAIADTGALFSGTIIGNGNSIARALHDDPNWVAEQYQLLANAGYIVFDLAEYKRDIITIEYPMHYMVMYAKDYNLFKELLIKYQHNIVDGEHNWRK